MNTNTKYTVSGWIRKQSMILCDSSGLFSNIPQFIYNICLCYYESTNRWDTKLKSECIILSNDNTCIYHSNSLGSWHHCFGETIKFMHLKGF